MSSNVLTQRVATEHVPQLSVVGEKKDSQSNHGVTKGPDEIQDGHDWLWTYQEEPHRTRRQQIIKAHPEVRRFFQWPVFFVNRCRMELEGRKQADMILSHRSLNYAATSH